jgi:hypothetical protein
MTMHITRYVLLVALCMSVSVAAQQGLTFQPAEPAGKGIIRGVVTAADTGRPMRNASIFVQGADPTHGSEIRLSGLAPGEYFVSAEGGRYLYSSAAAPRQQEVLTFYPGTDMEADAQPVTVGLGDEVVAAFSMVLRMVSPATTN